MARRTVCGYLLYLVLAPSSRTHPQGVFRTEVVSELGEVSGSPGWARTSDFLINRPTLPHLTRTHQHLSACEHGRSHYRHLRVDAGSSGCVGTTVDNTQTLGVRSVRARQAMGSNEELSGKSRLMGRRLAPVGELARDRARTRGEGLLRSSPRGGRPRLSPEERRRRARERKRRWLASRVDAQRGRETPPGNREP